MTKLLCAGLLLVALLNVLVPVQSVRTHTILKGIHQRVTGAAAARDVRHLSIILMDESGSIGAGNFSTMKDFVYSFVDLDRSRKNKSELLQDVAVIKFNRNIHTVIEPTSLADAVKDAVKATPFGRGQTNLGGALQRALDMHTAHPGQTMITLLTDARQNSGPDPVPVAEQLRNQNVLIYVNAFGADVDYDMMSRIAGGEDFVARASFSQIARGPRTFVRSMLGNVARAAAPKN